MNNYRLLFCLVVLALLMLDVTHVMAQDAREEAFREAEDLIRTHSREEGIALMDSLFQDDPADYRVYIRLKEAYIDRGDYEQAAEVAARYLESGDPTSAGYADLARLHHEAGNIERADEMWDRALQVAPAQLSTYQAVYRSLTEAQRFNEAVEIIYLAREELNQPDAFKHELPYLLAASARYEEAGREYAQAVRSSPDRLDFTKNRMAPFFDRDDAKQPLLAGVSQMVREHERNATLRRLMGWLYIQDDQFEKALSAKKAADELGQRDGQVVLDFAEVALDASAFLAASEALDYLIGRYPHHVEMERIRFLRAEAFHDAARTAPPSESDRTYSDAIEAYQSYIDHHRDGDRFAEALQRIGEIQMEHLGDFEQAVETLEQVRDEVTDPEVVHKAEFNLARAAILQSSFDEADSLLERVSSSGLPDLALRSQVQRSRLAMLQGDFEAAMNFANAASSHPTSESAREAIQLRLLLIENRNAPDSTALVRYAEAMFSFQQGDFSQTISQLDDIINKFPAYPLADDARLLRADALLHAGQSDKAREAYAALAEERPRSPVADQGLYEAARLFEAENPAHARALYLRLLRTYPASLHAPEARDRARELPNL